MSGYRFAPFNLDEVLKNPIISLSPLPKIGFLFNPSIAHISNNIYLLVVRNNQPTSLGETPPLAEGVDPIRNKNHPWSNRWMADFIDSTLVYFIEFFYKEGTVRAAYLFQQMNLVDVRLYKINETATTASIKIYGNTFQYGGINKYGEKCNYKKISMSDKTLMVDKLTLKVTGAEEPYYDTCMQQAECSEKNWSLFTAHKQLHWMYSLTPALKYFKTKDECDTEVDEVTNLARGTVNIFEMWEERYGCLEKCGATRLSVSTPLFSLKDGIYGVGHMKIKISYIKLCVESLRSTTTNTQVSPLFPKDDPMIKWFDRRWEKILTAYNHFEYFYFAFFYRFTVKGTNHVVDMRMSPLFLLADYFPYTLIFPSGMVVDEDQVMVSYGEADLYPKIFSIPTDYLVKATNYKTMDEIIRSNAEIDCGVLSIGATVGIYKDDALTELIV